MFEPCSREALQQTPSILNLFVMTSVVGICDTSTVHIYYRVVHVLSLNGGVLSLSNNLPSGTHNNNPGKDNYGPKSAPNHQVPTLPL